MSPPGPARNEVGPHLGVGVCISLSDGLAARLLDSADKFDVPAQALPLAEVYGRLTQAVWSELDGRGSIAPARREWLFEAA